MCSLPTLSYVCSSIMNRLFKILVLIVAVHNRIVATRFKSMLQPAVNVVHRIVAIICDMLLQEKWLLQFKLSSNLSTAGRRVYLCNDDRDVVTSGDVARMVQPFEEDGAFGNDDRAGFNGQLHRLSVMRNRVCLRSSPCT